MGISNQYFDELIRPAYVMTISVTVLLFMAILGMAIWMAYLQNKRLTDVVETAEEAFPKERTRNAYQYIANVVTELDSQRKYYEEEVRLMSFSLQGALLGRLLAGKVYTDRDAEQCRKVLALPEKGSYCCACVQIWGIAEQETTQRKLDSAAKVKNAIYGFFEEQGIRCLLYNGEALILEILFCLPELLSGPDSLRDLWEKSVGRVQQKTGLAVTMGIGVTVTTLEEIGWSAKCARNALRMTGLEDAVQTFSGRGSKGGPLFSLHQAQKLSELLTSGEMRYAGQFMQALAESAGRAHPSDEEIFQIFYGLRGTLESVAASILEEREAVSLPEFNANVTLKNLILSFLPSCNYLCTCIRSRQSEKAAQKQHRIVDYIRENYGNSSLCAASIAEAFHVSEKYVFQVVKTCTGQSMGDFLEALRLKKAEELLRDNVDINEIPARIGYNSINTFYKAFKRVYQMSPGKWRTANADFSAGKE